MQDYTEAPEFKLAYSRYVSAFMMYNAGLREFPQAEYEELREVVRIITGRKEYPN